MKTIYGPVCDMIGASAHTDLVQGPRGPVIERRFQATPAGGVREVQPEKIPVDYAHQGRQLGEIVYLERTNKYLWAVAHINDGVTPAVNARVAGDLIAVETPMYWSGMFDSNMAGTDTIIRAAAITPSPAQTCLEPLVWLDGALDYSDAWKRWQLPDGYPRRLLERACHSHRDRKQHGGPLIVFDQGHRTGTTHTIGYERTQTPTIEVRSATLGAISEHRREISAIVVPYSTPAIVSIRGKRVREVIAPGAFNGVHGQNHTIRLNLDHNPEKVIGKAIEWDTTRSDGLLGVFRLSRVPLADQALELASEDCLDCSVGFGVEHESWPQPDLRMVHSAFLDHVALTSQPAYRDAKVLGVRDREHAALR